jgi:predicted nucleic acid-binding protein
VERGLSAHLLDTSVVIGPADTPLPEAAAISVVTLGELSAGVELARDGRTRTLRERRLVAARQTFEPIAVDEEVADRYGEILAAARSAGRTTKATDLLIVATAKASGRVLHTLDERQAGVARVAGVEVG